MRKFLSALFGTLFLACLAGLLYYGWKEVHKYQAIQKSDEEVRTYRTVEDHITRTSENKIIIDWDGLLAVSPNVVGWIVMENNEHVDYPIMQSTDNDYYLNHTWDDETSVGGSIFLSSENKSNFTDQNSILYGHRMRNRSMFGSFKWYTDQEYLDEHSTFTIYTPDGKIRIYEIFCCSRIDDATKPYTIGYTDIKERQEAINYLRRHAVSERNVEVGPLDTTVLLSTCANANHDTRRIVVAGKLIKVGEQE